MRVIKKVNGAIVDGNDYQIEGPLAHKPFRHVCFESHATLCEDDTY
jgi:hypothetical protein